MSESLSKEFFKSQVSFINSDYGNSRHVSYRCNLDVGKYLLMATTYEPGEESGKFRTSSFYQPYMLTISLHLNRVGYTVRILGNSIKLAQLETQTMMLLDPFPPISTLRNESDAVKEKRCQYEPVFMQLADENK